MPPNRRRFLVLLAASVGTVAGGPLATAGGLPNHTPKRGGVAPNVEEIPPQRIPRTAQRRRKPEQITTGVVEFRCPKSSRDIRRRC